MTRLAGNGGSKNFTGQWAPKTLNGFMDPSTVLPLENFQGDVDAPQGAQCMSNDVGVWVADAYENYAVDEMQGTQATPLEEIAEDVVFMQPQFPDANFYEELYEPGEFWFATGPPTALDDETGQTRGQTCLPDYLEPDDEIDPSDADWQNPTTLNDATCTFPYVAATSSGNTASSTTHTITLPTGGVIGDIIFISFTGTGGGNNPTPPTGWTRVRPSTFLSPTVEIVFKVVDGTEAATVDITLTGAVAGSYVSYLIKSADPYFGPAISAVAQSTEDPNSLTTSWGGARKTLWIASIHAASCATPTGIANYTVARIDQFNGNSVTLVSTRTLETATENPGLFNLGTPPSFSEAYTIAFRGFCTDNLNDDPAGCSVPSDLEPEAELLQDGWQHGFAALDDPLQVFEDPRTGTAYQPDWLEPDAEPNPDDVTFGWQRQSLVEEDYQPGNVWTAVTEPPEDVFEESPEWVKTPQQDFAGDDDPAPRYVPDDMELEDEPLQDGWQQSVTVEDFPLDPDILRTAIPDDLEPEAEPDTNGWFSAPLHDFPDNEDINNRAVPDDLEPEAEPDTNGWFSTPLHDTPSTADITGTSVPDTVLLDDEVDCDGWAFRLPDMEAAPVVIETPDPGVSVGTLPGVRPRRKWWVENISAEEKKRKRIHGTRWPDLPDVDVPKKFSPRVITDKMARPRLDATHRDWKNRIRKARQRDDEIIMAIIAVLLAEGNDDT